MLTLFTVPKPFCGHIGLIQHNALRSWAASCPACEIILLGDEDGTEAAARDVGARRIPAVARNEFGTPLLDSVFAAACQAAAGDVLCYVNCDVILLSDFSDALSAMPLTTYLAVGRRWDLHLADRIACDSAGWETPLRRLALSRGSPHAPTGSDFFAFPRNRRLAEMPPFAVGRPGWDNWLIFRARQLDVPVVDISEAALIIHQNHGYEHVPQSRDGCWSGPEGDRNLLLAGGWKHIYTLEHATHRLTRGRALMTLDGRSPAPACPQAAAVAGG